MQPFTSTDDERLYHCHKLFAESFTTNLRNLEAPWKPVIASVLEAIVEKARSSANMAVQQEQPLAPPVLSAASQDADRTMTSNHKGTLYPDVSVLRYLVGADSNFRAVSRNDMNHTAVDYLVCAELKRSVKREHIQRGLKDEGQTRRSYKVLLKFLRDATVQAERQAFVAMKRPGVVNSDIVLIAASGPLWMWCLARRATLLGAYSKMEMEVVLQEAESERVEDREAEEVGADLDDLEGDDGYNPNATAPFDVISAQEVLRSEGHTLPWSRVVMLNTRESESELRSVLKTLIVLVEQK